MSKRPLSVTIVGYLFIVAGAIGVAYHATEFQVGRPFQYDLLFICLVRLLAIVFGLYVIRGSNWARWGLLIWMASHVILSAFHSLTDFAVHALLLAVIAYMLFRSRTSMFFRDRRHER